MTDLEMIAYHEAGHAVMAAELGVPFDRVTITPDVDSAGHLALRDPDLYVHGDDVGPGDRDTRSSRLTIVWLAGRIAKQEYCRHKRDVDAAFEHGRWDMQQAYTVSANTSSGHEDTERFLNESEELAHEAVEQSWLGIQTVAEALLARIELSEAEVKQILQDTYGSFEEIIRRRERAQE